jgi:putative SOS response-associated peptidase YedK
MCGRYYSLFDKQQAAEHFHVKRKWEGVNTPPNYNITPDTFQPVIRLNHETGEREIVDMRWGIVPWFAKTEDEFRKLSTINAKSDRLLDSKMWREPFAKRRCLVPASGLYEWPKENMAVSQFYPEPPQEAGPVDLFGTAEPTKRKGPKPKPVKRVFKITMADEGATPFAFAGIWDSWKRSDGTRLETFAIVTTEPNELVSQIHERLALILHPRDYDRWLGVGDKGDPRPPLDLLRPYDSDKMKMLPANPGVGNVRNIGPEMLDEPDGLHGL